MEILISSLSSQNLHESKFERNSFKVLKFFTRNLSDCRSQTIHPRTSLGSGECNYHLPPSLRRSRMLLGKIHHPRRGLSNPVNVTGPYLLLSATPECCGEGSVCPFYRKRHKGRSPRTVEVQRSET